MNGLRRCVPSFSTPGSTPFAPSGTRNPFSDVAAGAAPVRMSAPVSAVTTPTWPGLITMSSQILTSYA